MPRPVKWTPRIAAIYANGEIAEALSCFPEDVMLSKEEKEKREQDRERRIQAEAYGCLTLNPERLDEND